MQRLWCWRCQAEMPMLDEDEFAEMHATLQKCVHDVKNLREVNDSSLTDSPIQTLFTPALAKWKELTGHDETNHNAISHHRISIYGPPCEECGKVLRTPTASKCWECGNERSPGPWIEERTVPLIGEDEDPWHGVPPPNRFKMRLDFYLLHFKALVLRDLHAWFSIGEAYAIGEHFGFPVAKKPEVAVRWYSHPARRGHRDAQYELGFMYLSGEGVAADPEEGLRWMTAAAEHNYAEPMRVLADVYSQGIWGVEVDEGLAKVWADRLADHLKRHPEDRRDYEREADG